jgi:hypothetical protein
MPAIKVEAADTTVSLVRSNPYIKCVPHLANDSRYAQVSGISTYFRQAFNQPSGNAGISYSSTIEQVEKGVPMVYIYFTGVNSANDTICYYAGMLFQSPLPGESKAFYGFVYDDADEGSRAAISVAAYGSADPANKVINFTSAPYEGANIKSVGYSLVVDDPGNLFSKSAFFPPDSSGGGGSTTSGPCAIFSTPAAVSACGLNITPRFIDIATISYRGEIYTTNHWGGSKINYYLAGNPPEPNRKTYNIDKGLACRPFFTIDADSGSGLDINIDSTSLGDLQQIEEALARAISNGSVNAKYTDFNYSCAKSVDGADMKIGDPINTRFWATYYDKTKTVNLLFTESESNERPYLSVYKITDNTVVNYNGTPLPGCENAAPHFEFGQDPATLSSSTVGVSANWWLNTSSPCEDYAKVNVLVRIAPKDQDPPAITNGADTVQEDANGASGDTSPDCESSGPLSWLLCAVFNVVSTATDWLFSNLVQPLLHTTPVSTNPDDGSFKVWSNFRLYGNIFLIIALLVLIFGQTIGGGMVDAYTAKKMAPRLLIAAVMINLSIYIVALMVDITNILGGGLGSLMIAPFKSAAQFQFSLDGLQVAGIGAIAGGGIIASWAAGVLTAGALGAAMPAIGLFVLLPALLGLLGAFITLVIRQGLILFLILSSPVAFALYCLPNTERYFRKWWKLFFETLLVYPAIIAIFALADIMTITIQQANGMGDAPLLDAKTIPLASGHILAAIIAFVLQFLPLMLIPFAFKFVGGAIGSLYATLSGHGKSLSNAIKGDARDPYSLRNRTKNKMFAELARGQQQVTDRGGVLGASRGRRARGRFAGLFGNVEGRMARFNKEQAQLAEDMSATGRDHFRYAAAGYEIKPGEVDSLGNVNNTGRSLFFNSKGEQISVQEYRKGKSLFGNTTGGIGAQLEYTTRKAQSAESLGQMRFAFAKNAIANNWTENEMGDVWAQATFPHKDKWLSEWFSSPRPTNGVSGSGGVTFDDVDTSDKSFDKMLNEGHRTKESFRWSSLRSQDWQAMNTKMMDIQGRIDSGTATAADLERYAKIGENLDAMARSPMNTLNDQGEVMVSGASPETQDVITAMYKSRKYGVAPLQTAPGEYSTTERAIYDRAAVDAAMMPVRGAPPPGPGARDAEIARHTVGTATVTTDRTPITRHTTVT